MTLAVNGTEYGIYVNVEQRDKSFLQNRSIWDAAHTWIYKFRRDLRGRAISRRRCGQPHTDGAVLLAVLAAGHLFAACRTTPRSRRSSTR